MYQSYWNLAKQPFECDFDPACFYESTSHAAAVLKLKYLVEQSKGAGVLAADSGLGKTFLTHVLESRLADRHSPVVRLLYPRLDAAGVLAQIAIRLGVNPDDVDSANVSTDQIVERLKARLAKSGNAGRSPVIIVDDAHMIESDEVWHALRLLLNFREESHHEAGGIDFTLLLVGQPQLLGHLRTFADLYDRLAVRVSLSPLDIDGVHSYLSHRLSVSGSDESPFSDDAIEMLADLSGGVPRKINQLADLTMLVGFADKLEQITAQEMAAASEEMLIASVD